MTAAEKIGTLEAKVDELRKENGKMRIQIKWMELRIQNLQDALRETEATFLNEKEWASG